MKILMLNHEFPPVGGGAAPVTLELCRHLVGMGHHVDVVTMHYGDLPRHECIDGVNIYRTPAIRKRPNICYTHEMATYLPGALCRTLRLAKKEKYDVIHCHFIIPGGPLAWIVSKVSKIPVLMTCHGSDVPGYNPDRFGFMHKLLLPVWRSLVRSYDMLVSPSESLKNLVENSCPCVSVKVIPNGIYASSFDTCDKTKSILMCSRILPRKGFQYVIEAIHDIDMDWEVNVVGEGPYLEELRSLAEGLKAKIVFWGWLDQKDPKFRELYQESSIFVFPSEAENFPTVLLEAMSAGMAIITSTAGGCPEVVGDAALLVEPRDVNGIRESIMRLIGSRELRQQLSTAALDRVEQFNWSNVASRYVDCYRELADKKNRSNT